MSWFWEITSFDERSNFPKGDQEDRRWEMEVGRRGKSYYWINVSMRKRRAIVFHMMTFEDLESWQKARANVRKIYRLTRGGEVSRDFGISGQLQRSGVSVMSNLAEGFERTHLPEKLQFYNVARGSTAEIRSLLYVIEDNFPESAVPAAVLREEIVSVGKLVSGLIRSTKERKSVA
jgi:four helix bundle protein